MYVILYGAKPYGYVKTEVEAQELVADLAWEDLLDGFNWMMRISTVSVQRALDHLVDSEWRYVHIEEIE